MMESDGFLGGNDWPGDRIRIADLEVRARHGVLPEEKALGQKFVLGIDMEMDLQPAGQSDALERSVSYSEVARAVTEWFGSGCDDLIETGAERVARSILLRWQTIRAVTVCVKKPWAPIGLPLDTVSVTIRRAWHRAYLGLGSNLGDREATLREALSELSCEDVLVTAVSSFHETKPVGFLGQPVFLNGAACLWTLRSPLALLALLREVEANHGRTRDIRWGPRTLDLDLLLYDDLVTDSPALTLPHPRMLERRFVLDPLCEIAPWVVHPLTRQRLIDAKQALPE